MHAFTATLAAGAALLVAPPAAPVAPPASAAAFPVAPGAPGTAEGFLPADKAGFATATATGSPVWLTVQKAGGLGEVFYPDLDTPSARLLRFAVSDGRRAVAAAEAARVRTELLDERSLTYRQTFTERSGRWRLAVTYATDPSRPTALAEVRFAALDRRHYDVYADHDPALSGTPDDDTGRTESGPSDDGRAGGGAPDRDDGRAGSGPSDDDRAGGGAPDGDDGPAEGGPVRAGGGAAEGGTLVASDGAAAGALAASPPFAATTSGYRGGPSDGWRDLLADGRLDTAFRSATAPGNLVQTARLRLDRGGRATLALGFGAGAGAAVAAAHRSLAEGFGTVLRGYARGWHRYLDTLHAPPAVLRGAEARRLYRVSVMVLAASEDKAHRGAYVASPSMPWAWGRERPSGPYHLVWSRDLYQIATALVAAGDRAGAGRALDYLFDVQQKPDGSFPQNSRVDGTPVWEGLQLDEVALPVVLAHQLGRTGPADWEHVRRARTSWSPPAR